MNKKKKIKENVVGYSFILPATIILFAFVILPIFISVGLSFMKFNGFNTPSFIGFKNYIDMFKDADFVQSMKNTFIFVLLTVPLQTVLSLAFAAIIAENFKNPFGEFIRGTMFIPVLCSASIAGTLFYYLFASDAEAAVNSFLAIFGIAKQNWLGQKSTALLVVALTSIWKDVGYYLVIFYASIMDVPVSLYEAAKVDGASAWQRFFYVTLPSIKPVLFLVITLSTIWGFQVFDITYTMTRGGPGNATLSPVLIVYETAFSTRKMGYACAVACILAICIFIITIIQRKAFKDK